MISERLLVFLLLAYHLSPIPNFLEKPDRVGKFQAATDFGRELLDEREMIAVFLIE